MSNLLHGPISTNQILPREKRVNRGFLWWINVDKLSIYGSLSIDLKFVAHIFPKWLVFANYVSLPNVLPPTGQFFYTALWALPKNVDTRQSETKATYFVRLGCLKMDIGHCLDTTMVTCPGTCKIGISSSRCKTTQDNVTVQLSPLLSWIRCAGKNLEGNPRDLA